MVGIRLGASGVKAATDDTEAPGSEDTPTAGGGAIAAMAAAVADNLVAGVAVATVALSAVAKAVRGSTIIVASVSNNLKRKFLVSSELVTAVVTETKASIGFDDGLSSNMGIPGSFDRAATVDSLSNMRGLDNWSKGDLLDNWSLVDNRSFNSNMSSTVGLALLSGLTVLGVLSNTDGLGGSTVAADVVVSLGSGSSVSLSAIAVLLRVGSTLDG